jgi:hypothetical protein
MLSDIASKSVGLAERFWSKVNKNGPVHPTLGTACWEWTGRTMPPDKGSKYATKRLPYGQISVGGTKMYTHRLGYALQHGLAFLDSKLLALHQCDNPKCVRHDHIQPGTNRDNTLDAIAKGRLVPPTRWSDHERLGLVPDRQAGPWIRPAHDRDGGRRDDPAVVAA